MSLFEIEPRQSLSKHGNQMKSARTKEWCLLCWNKCSGMKHKHLLTHSARETRVDLGDGSPRKLPAKLLSQLLGEILSQKFAHTPDQLSANITSLLPATKLEKTLV